MTPLSSANTLPDLGELWQQTLAWQPNSLQYTQFQQLYTRILDGNRQLNLTRITDPTDFWEKHLWDSLRGIQRFLATADPLRVIDIGTGAGFPGIPVAIACPDWHLTLLDSTRKKVDFLTQLVTDLSLPNITTVIDRAEQIGRSPAYRATYDLALIRAVAAATVCAEYTLPLLKVGGVAILYRGRWSQSEAEALHLAVTVLGGVVHTVEAFQTPLSAGDRHCVYLQKIAPTPSVYPRAIGIPAQKPLPDQEGEG